MNDDSNESSFNESNNSFSLDDFVSHHLSSPHMVELRRAVKAIPLPVVLRPLPTRAPLDSSSSFTSLSLSETGDKLASTSTLSDSAQGSSSKLSSHLEGSLSLSLPSALRSVASARSFDDSFASLNLEAEEEDTEKQAKQQQVQSGSAAYSEDSALSMSKVTVRFDESISTKMASPRHVRVTLNDSALHRISYQSPVVLDDGSVEPGAAENSESSSSDDTPPAVQPKSVDDEDSPELLIRDDTRYLRLFRVMVYLVLMTAAVVAVFYVYQTSSSTQIERFHAEFDEVGSRLVESFLHATNSNFWMARTTSAFLMQLMESGRMTQFNFTISSFADVTATQQQLSIEQSVFWSPYLETIQELESFEYFATKAEGATPTMGNRLVADGIFAIVDDSLINDQSSAPPYFPVWLEAGANNTALMYNQYSDARRRKGLDVLLQRKLPIMIEHHTLEGNQGVLLFYPVFSLSGNVVGSVTKELAWTRYLGDGYGSLPPNSGLADIVVESSCTGPKTFRIQEEELVLVGEGDLHEQRFGEMEYASTYEEFHELVDLVAGRGDKVASVAGYCSYRFCVHATTELEAQFVTGKPVAFAVIAVLFFVFTAGIFLMYDYLVTRRQRKVMESARRSNAIVSSLFPKSIRNRLYDEATDAGSIGTGGGSSKGGGSSGKGDSGTHPSSKSASSGLSASASSRNFFTPKNRLKTFLESAPGDEADSEPIADLFPAATVMFLDIAGFTAWSSEREPTQVFKLLETIYQSFDEVTRKLGVFKIETIGDSYVAVSGVPDPRDDHAVAMSKFAFECLKRFNRLTKQLEVQLGPSTGELQARVGLHSGSVTGGVLRGEKARFQLFGDTMNTAARMESTGTPGMIQASKATAELLIKAGKENWVTPRADRVSAKGKGQMETYWIESNKSGRNSIQNHAASSEDDLSDVLDALVDPIDSLADELYDPLSDASKVAKSMRLINWNVEILYGLLQKIVANRDAAGGRPRLTRGNSVHTLVTDDESRIMGRRCNAIDEVADVIEMPRFDPRAAKRLADSDGVTLDPAVKEQLRDYVMRIASMYRDVPFHSFEHASHVAMSAHKLLGRIIKPNSIDCEGKKDHEIAREVYYATYGISSDPLMQFAIVIAALIHDVDHTGLTNSQLVKLLTPCAIMYKNKSVAEQNSIDVAWTVLMDEDFDQLRSCIYSSKQELRRFRQLIVNAVMATDLADEGVQADRQSRWEKAFGGDAIVRGRRDIRDDRKATIVFEYIIQASDVAHTMQHWCTYQKWNTRLFEERFLSFIDWKEKCDPVFSWYQGELDFFDKYIIPLTERLRQCGVFGVSSSELLNWALENRREWELQGEDILEKMHTRARALYPPPPRCRSSSPPGKARQHSLL